MRKQIYSALDIMDLKLNNICNVKQYDDIILSLEIRDNGKAIDLTDNTVTIKVIRQDKQILEQTDNISLKNNIVTIKLKNEALSCIGLTKFELHIKDTDGSISTATFSLNVEESISLENVIDNTTHKNIIELLQDTKIDTVKLENNILTFYANKKEITSITLLTSSGTITEGHDGKDGKDGVDGISLNFNWRGTELGVKRSDQTSYTYIDLKGATGADGRNGQDGLSAYEIAQQNGFKGTEKEWLSSLKGKDGIGGSASTEKVNLSDVVLDEKGLQTLNAQIAYKHNHEGNQVVCSTKKWADNKYILEDILDFMQKEIEELKAKIK